MLFNFQIYFEDECPLGTIAAGKGRHDVSKALLSSGLVASSCSASCVAVSDAAQYFNVPQIGHGCTTLDLSDYVRHPFFTRVVPSYQQGVLAAGALLVKWNWYRLGVAGVSEATSKRKLFHLDPGRKLLSIEVMDGDSLTKSCNLDMFSAFFGTISVEKHDVP